MICKEDNKLGIKCRALPRRVKIARYTRFGGAVQALRENRADGGLVGRSL